MSDTVLPVQIPACQRELQTGVGYIHIPLLRVRRQRNTLTRHERVQKGQSAMVGANAILGVVNQETGDVRPARQGLQHAGLYPLVSQGKTQVVQDVVARPQCVRV